jgi:ABC-type Fe3+-citrate transport system substrate-binding protein
MTSVSAAPGRGDIWGSTTVEEAPERVVVLGVTDADPVLALDVVSSR